jgi:hypothetical protein
MVNRRQCEFFLLRYVPDAVKNEFVNFGVVMIGDNGFAEVRLTKDWRRVRCLDPDADVDMLVAIEEAVRRQLKSADGRDQLLRLIADSFSNTVQLSPATACLAEDPLAEVERLAEMYLESARHERPREASGRQVIVGHMRDAFERAGVWTLMNKSIPVAKYTRSGDPLKLDCGYRPNGVIKLFHAISLATDVNAAKVLAFSYPQIADGITRLERAKSELTAIVEAGLDRADEQIGFAVETLERSRIAIATTADMEQIAQRARLELRV